MAKKSAATATESKPADNARVEALREEVAKLREEVEKLTHRLSAVAR